MLAVLAAAPARGAATLSQCANGPLAAPAACSWPSGNVSGNSAHWLEGESVPFRIVFASLTPGTHTVTLEWSTTTSARHAVDFLTSVDRTESGVDPCSDLAGCAGTYSLYPIPADPNVAAPIPGSFRCYGGTINTVSVPFVVSGSYGSTSLTGLTIVFTTPGTDAVIAFGAHLASQDRWGCSTALPLSGSPYHVILDSFDGVVTNQDRALGATAVLGPPCLTSSLSASAIASGQSVTDQVTLYPGASGTLRFFACGPRTGATPCAGEGVQVGGDVVSLTGEPVTSAPFSPSSPVGGTYCFRVEYTPDVNGAGQYTAAVSSDTTGACFRLQSAASVGGPAAGRRLVAGPNPARSPVNLRCGLAPGERAFVEVLDAAGRVQRRLALEPAGGEGRAQWDLRDGFGARVPSGVYLLRLVTAEGRVGTARVEVLR